MQQNVTSYALACLTAAVVTAVGAHAQEFRARTVTLLIGFAPGGGYDTYGHVIARYWGRHLPGNPNVVAQNMPGGGSLNVANLIFNAGAQDGSQLGLFASSAALEPLLGNAQAKFDTAKFAWIGNINRDVSGCGAWSKSGIKTWDDAVKRGAKFGGVGLSAPTTQHAAFMKNVLGVPFKVITGYGGSNDVNLAMQRGEVDASCGLFVSTVKGPYAKDIASGDLRMIVQFGRTDEPEFGTAVNIYGLLPNAADKQLADFVFRQIEIARPIAASPRTPPAITAVLRQSFEDTMRDPEFRAEAERLQIDANHMTGAETAQAFAEFAATPAEVVERAKAAIVP